MIVVPFRGLNSWLGTAYGVKFKMTIVRVILVPFRVFKPEKIG